MKKMFMWLCVVVLSVFLMSAVGDDAWCSQHVRGYSNLSRHDKRTVQRAAQEAYENALGNGATEEEASELARVSGESIVRGV